MLGPQPPAIPFPAGDFTGEYEIRTQQDFQALFDSIKADFNGANWDEWLEGELRRLEKAHDERFKTAGASFFTNAGGWAPNAPSTVRKKGHARVLFGKPSEGFRLHKSLTQPASEFGIRVTVDNWPTLAELVFGTDAPYHIYNQLGTGRIPARPHVGMTAEHFEQTAKRAIDHVFAAIQES